MKFRPRVTPSLLMKQGSLVKGAKFTNYRYLGDPLNAVKVFNDLEVDELSLCEISDEPINFGLLEKICSRAFMPLLYGGNILSLEDAKILFHLGFERLIVNSLFFHKQDEVKRIVDTFGSSSVCVTIDYRYNFWNRPTAFKNGAKSKLKSTLEDLVLEAEKLKIGETILQHVDAEGSGSGVDLTLLRRIRSIAKMQLSVSGGVGSFSDIHQACLAGADGVIVGDYFLFSGEMKGLLLTYPQAIDLEKLYEPR